MTFPIRSTSPLLSPADRIRLRSSYCASRRRGMSREAARLMYSDVAVGMALKA